MAIMDYVTPGLTKIDFEDSLFVTTELDGDENKEVKEYIESRGGVIKNSVTKTTNYLIYGDGKEQTTKYQKALEMIRDKGLEITVLSLKTFSDLLTMKDTPDISEISIKGKRFVASGLDKEDLAKIKKYVVKHGGNLEKSVTEKTDYLIYQNHSRSIDRFIWDLIHPNHSRWIDRANWEGEEYAKAVSMDRNGDSDITFLSFNTFSDLVSMKQEPPDVPEILIKGRRFADTGLDERDREVLAEHLEKHGGILEDSVTDRTDYLVFQQEEWETTEYVKALSMFNSGGSGITLLSYSTFVDLGRQALGTIEFGTCLPEKGSVRMPIRWIVVKKEQNKALLLSADRIGHRPYNEKWEDVTWETCTLRKWLNGDFYNDAFTEEEKKRILLTKVRNEDNPRTNTLGGNDTEDKVFLLSLREAEVWLTRIERRNGWRWWLRSPGYCADHAAYVSYSGGISDVGYGVDRSDYAVCPALWIDLGSEIE